MDSALVGKLLLAVGLLVALAGLLVWMGVRLPFGRLPGDLSGSSGSVSWAVPLGTCLVISVVLTVLVNLLVRR
ncbi:MAG TPA: DUF2905 family protein [Candidatus Dormibacteraeota bacterium]|nr:DUF2905 family protein [Candidatus Dormibacteraeota bacterium]